MFRHILLFSMLLKCSLPFVLPIRDAAVCLSSRLSYRGRTDPIFLGKTALRGVKQFLHTKAATLLAPKRENQKLISISPGGFKGFYMMGVIAFLKETYDLSDYIFSGASAGSWNAILCTYRGNLTELITHVIGDKPTLGKNDSIHAFEQLMKLRIIAYTAESDFDLSRVFIGVTTFKQFGNKRAVDHLSPGEQNAVAKTTGSFIKTSIYSNFINLEDALNCCIASSHIPLITGGFTTKDKDTSAFDGGFSHYPYYTSIKPTLHITPGMWEPAKNKTWYNIEDYTTLLSKEKYNFNDLFHEGYEDTKKNRHKLDKIFLP